MATPDLFPTEQDRSRDLLADLSLCDAATPGPWRSDWRGTNHFELTTHAPGAKDFWLSMPDAGLQKGEDLDMIAASREGWPAAIRRALAVEVEVACLRQRVEELEQQRREQE